MNSSFGKPEEKRMTKTSANDTTDKKLTNNEPANSDAVQDVEVNLTTEITNAASSKDKR